MTGQPAADFAGLLRRLRKESQLTQEELAEEAALSLRTIQDLEERHHRTAHKSTAENLANALGLTGPAHALFVKAATGRAVPAEVLAARAAAAAARPAATVAARAAATPVPRELPADVAAFTGRAGELATLDAFLPAATEPGSGPDLAPGPVVISAVSGTAGAGKTALAVHWAHRVARHFPDGQLYVNLRGFDPEQPVTADDALAGFLGALGVTSPDFPLGEAARAARYRSLLAGRRLLVVLDNAATEEQVRPLLPGSPSVMVIVTSRTTLPGLVARDGARRLDLDLLPGDDAVALLHTLIGDRVNDDPAATQALAGLCARLPLALRVAAERAAARPGMPLATLVDELADERDRLQLLDAGGDARGAVASVLSWSYRHLPGDVAQMFRLLGLHPAQDWDRHAAAALAATTPGRAGQLLDTLARTHLIQAAGPGRYGMHDLLRAYAAELAATHDPDQARQAALTRLFDYYLAACAAAMDCLAPAERHQRPEPPAVDTPVPDFGRRDATLAWLDAELATLVTVADAASRGWPQHGIQLGQTLHRYLDGVHDAKGLTIHQHALAAARACGDRAAQARTLTTLGVIYSRQGHYTQATDCHHEAIALARETGDQLTHVWALGNLALVHNQQGRYPEAARCARRAIALCRELGDVSGEAIALINLGLVNLRQGRYQRAAGHLQRAITLHRKVGHRVGEAAALTNLGQVRYRMGNYQQAADDQAQALALARETGSPRVEAWALTRSGEVSCRLGQHEQASIDYEQALELFRENGDSDGEAEALNGAGENLRATGQIDRARGYHDAALGLTRRTGGKREEARALLGLGEISDHQGQYDQATSYQQQALAIYRVIDDPGGQAEAFNSAGETELASGQPDQALTSHDQALTLTRRTGDRYQQARAHHGLANAYSATGQPGPGHQHWQHALDIYTDLGVPGPPRCILRSAAPVHRPMTSPVPDSYQVLLPSAETRDQVVSDGHRPAQRHRPQHLASPHDDGLTPR